MVSSFLSFITLIFSFFSFFSLSFSLWSIWFFFFFFVFVAFIIFISLSSFYYSYFYCHQIFLNIVLSAGLNEKGVVPTRGQQFIIGIISGSAGIPVKTFISLLFGKIPKRNYLIPYLASYAFCALCFAITLYYTIGIFSSLLSPLLLPFSLPFSSLSKKDYY